MREPLEADSTGRHSPSPAPCPCSGECPQPTCGHLRRPFSLCVSPGSRQGDAGDDRPAAPRGLGSRERRLRRGQSRPGFAAAAPSSASRLPAPSLRERAWISLLAFPAAGPRRQLSPRAPGPAPRAHRTVGARRAGTGRAGGREGAGRDPAGPGEGPERPRRKGPGATGGPLAASRGDQGSPTPQRRDPRDWDAAPQGRHSDRPCPAGLCPGLWRQEPGVARGQSQARTDWGAGGARVWERRAQPGSPLGALKKQGLEGVAGRSASGSQVCAPAERTPGSRRGGVCEGAAGGGRGVAAAARVWDPGWF